MGNIQLRSNEMARLQAEASCAYIAAHLIDAISGMEGFEVTRWQCRVYNKSEEFYDDYHFQAEIRKNTGSKEWYNVKLRNDYSANVQNCLNKIVMDIVAGVLSND